MMQETSISLYLDLEEGTTADLEIVANAALAWNRMLKTYAAAVAPELGAIRVDWFDADYSSARLNNIIRAAWDGDPKAMLSLAGGAVLFLAMGPAIHFQDDVGQKFLGMFGHHDYVEISPETIDEIANKTADKLLLEQADRERRTLIKGAGRDRHVKGVGATLQPAGKPRLLVPRSEFHSLDEGDQKPPSLIKPHVEVGLPVTLLRPNLKEGSDGVWRFFNDELGEFSAKIADDEFLEVLREQRSGIELGFGIQMRVDLLTRDELVNGVWQVKDHTVKRVVWPAIKRRQNGLGL